MNYFNAANLSPASTSPLSSLSSLSSPAWHSNQPDSFSKLDKSTFADIISAIVNGNVKHIDNYTNGSASIYYIQVEVPSTCHAAEIIGKKGDFNFFKILFPLNLLYSLC